MTRFLPIIVSAIVSVLTFTGCLALLIEQIGDCETIPLIVATIAFGSLGTIGFTVTSGIVSALITFDCIDS